MRINVFIIIRARDKFKVLKSPADRTQQGGGVEPYFYCFLTAKNIIFQHLETPLFLLRDLY
jgi:hypothetical protein